MLYAIIAAVILIGDQWLKYWVTLNITLSTGDVALIPGVIKLVNIHNNGAAFGLLGSASYARWLFIGIAALFIIVIIVILAKRLFKSRFANWCAVLALAGAVGNCIDRALYGYVVDMFKLEFMDFAVFNVADIFLVFACFAFIIYLIADIFKGGKADKDEDGKKKKPVGKSGPVSDDEFDVSGIDTASPEFPDTAAPLVADDKAVDESEDFWASFEPGLRGGVPVKPKAAQPVKSAPQPVKPKAAQPVKSAPQPVKPKAKPKSDDYDLESILAEFRGD